MEVQAAAWATRNGPGGDPTHPPNVERQPDLGSPRIRDELAKLGLQASTATIRKYRPKLARRPSQSWRTFLQNHAGAIAAMDFFVVPTVTCRLLYVLVAMNHERRKSFISTLQMHQLQGGPPNKSSMRSPTRRHPSICCATGIRSTVRPSCIESRAWVSSRSSFRHDRLGKVRTSSDWWVRFGVNAWIEP